MGEKNFEKQIWNAASVLWGHIPAGEYRKIIMGLIFLRYISVVFEKEYNILLESGKGLENDRDEYIGNGVFFVPKEARWQVIAEASHSLEIGNVIDFAMEKIEEENDSLKGVLNKVYGNPDLDKFVLSEVVDVFTNMNLNDVENDTDLFGRVYEYCISQFAMYEGSKGGEFYTPYCIVNIIVSILKPFEGCKIYDPCCGSGGMFVQSMKYLQDNNLKGNEVHIYGQEFNSDTFKMAKMNMAIRGVKVDFGPFHADVFSNDLHKDLKADFIMANPPFNLSNWGQERGLTDIRWKYGIPSKNNANFAWIQHMIYHLAENGKIGLVLSNGALSSKSNGVGNIRRGIVEDDLIEGIISLPPQLFYSVTIPVTLWFITKNKKQKGKTIFIDASNMGHMVTRKHRDFKAEEVEEIVQVFADFQEGEFKETKGFCKVADIEDIREQNYILVPSRYVGIEEVKYDEELIDAELQVLVKELSSMFTKSLELQDSIYENFEAIGYDFK